MKKLFALLVCLGAVGCDFKVPLTTVPALDIDRQLVGMWERTKEDNKQEQLLVLPLGPREYLISFPAGNPDGAFAKVCLVKCADKLFAQVEWIGSAQGKLPDDGRVYLYATYTLRRDELRVNLLNSSLINRDIKTSAELAKAIEDNRDDAELFREPLVFVRATK